MLKNRFNYFIRAPPISLNAFPFRSVGGLKNYKEFVFINTPPVAVVVLQPSSSGDDKMTVAGRSGSYKHPRLLQIIIRRSLLDEILHRLYYVKTYYNARLFFLFLFFWMFADNTLVFVS